MTPGYLGDSAKGSLRVQGLSDGEAWLNTGDLGTVDADGFIWLFGREKAVPIDVVVIGTMPVTAVGKIFKPALRLDAMRRAAVKTVRATLGDASAVRVEVRETEARPAVTLGVPYGATADTAAELLRTAFVGYTFKTRIAIDIDTLTE